jgi:hypothetical protein
MVRRTRREHFSSAALSITDDLLHRSEPPGSADFVAKLCEGRLASNVNRGAQILESKLRIGD